MDQRNRSFAKAYGNEAFLNSPDARPLRILAEYLEPASRFSRYRVEGTIVFMGSARLVSREQAERELTEAERLGVDLEKAKVRLEMSGYYESARDLAKRLADWSKELCGEERRFVVCTGGGPGIMEAANQGASQAKGINVGLTISIPAEEFDNPYVTRELSFHFHYFFMRKFWFAYLAKAVIVFPGGFGTLDELFELLTLLQTRKMRKHLPVVLFGSRYWDEIIDFHALSRRGMINPNDLTLLFRTESVDEAYAFITSELRKYGLQEPGASL